MLYAYRKNRQEHLTADRIKTLSRLAPGEFELRNKILTSW